MRISDWSSDVCSSDLAVETAECWDVALKSANTPSLLALSRQNLPQLRTEAAENRSARGAYRLKAAEAPRKVVLIASGSEVPLALETAAKLEAEGVGEAVVSMPCWALFDAQDASYRSDLLQIGRAHVRTPVTNPQLVCRHTIEKKT